MRRRAVMSELPNAFNSQAIYDTVPDDGEPLVHSMVAERQRETPQTIASVHERQRSIKLQRSQSERIRDRAKALMRRMDIRNSTRRRTSGAHTGGQIEISSPILLHQHHSASPPVLRHELPLNLSG